MSETVPNRTLLWIHHLIRVPSWPRGIVFSRHQDWFPFFSWWRKSTVQVSNVDWFQTCLGAHGVDNCWSSDKFSNRCSYSCSRSPCRSSLACIYARGGCVRISTSSSWPGALGFSTALWETGNSSIISATAPQILSWLTEMTIWRSNSIFLVLPLKCIDFFPLPLPLKSPSHSYHGIRDDWSLRNSAAFSLQFCPKILLVCDRKFRTTSFKIQALRKTSDRGWIYEHTVYLIVFELFSHISSFPFASHQNSLNIDMNMILPVKFSGSHCNSHIICWIWLRIPIVVSPGKIFHSNSTGCPSIRFKS